MDQQLVHPAIDIIMFWSPSPVGAAGYFNEAEKLFFRRVLSLKPNPRRALRLEMLLALAESWNGPEQ